MRTYISMLRGINVSGKKTIKMDALRKLYEGLGYANVASYVQSGNVVFSCTDSAPIKIGENISRQIKMEFGHEVPVLVVSAESLKQVVEHNPFLNDKGKEQAYLHVTFLATPPAAYDLEAIESKKQNGEEFHISDFAVYLYCPNGYGKTKLNNNFLESKLKVDATTRNWKTTNKLLEIAEQTEKLG